MREQQDSEQDRGAVHGPDYDTALSRLPAWTFLRQFLAVLCR
jgi:hypothetical protein